MQEDIKKDVTLNPRWLGVQADRLLSWEIFVRSCLGLSDKEVPIRHIADRIGLNYRTVYKNIESARGQQIKKDAEDTLIAKGYIDANARR